MKAKKTGKFLIVFYVVVLLVFVLDFVVPRHGVFPFEEAFGFYAAFGFVSCSVLILVAKVFRFFVKRDKDYYIKKQ